MKSGTSAPDRWEHLGALLIQRRTQLSPRFHNRGVFCEAAGLNYRLIYDVEEARRTNFGSSTLAAIEAAYRLAPGAIGRFLAGGSDREILPAQDTAAAVNGITVRRETPPAPVREPLPDVLVVPSESELAPYLQAVTRDVWRAIGIDPGPGEPPEISEAMLAEIAANLPASRLFAEDYERDVWVMRDWPPEWRLRLVAIFRHMRAEGRAETGQADTGLQRGAAQGLQMVTISG